MLERVGFYRELEPDRPDLDQGSIFDFVREVSAPNEREVVDYLTSAVHVIDVMESVPDVISRDAFVKGGSSILTDGTWIWRWDLSYYTERYHLHLPDGFVSHVAENSFVAKPLSRDAICKIAEYVEADVLRMSAAEVPPLFWPRQPKNGT